DPFLTPREALAELPNLSEAQAEPGPREHGKKVADSERLAHQVPFEGLHVEPEDVHGPTILADGVVDLAQTEMQLDLEREVAEGSDKGKSTLAIFNGAVIVAHHKASSAQIGGDSRQSRWIVEGLGEGFGFTEAGKDSRVFSKWKKGITQVEPDIDGLLDRVALLGQMP